MFVRSDYQRDQFSIFTIFLHLDIKSSLTSFVDLVNFR
jgi:hypothetical protein